MSERRGRRWPAALAVALALLAAAAAAGVLFIARSERFRIWRAASRIEAADVVPQPNGIHYQIGEAALEFLKLGDPALPELLRRAQREAFRDDAAIFRPLAIQAAIERRPRAPGPAPLDLLEAILGGLGSRDRHLRRTTLHTLKELQDPRTIAALIAEVRRLAALGPSSDPARRSDVALAMHALQFVVFPQCERVTEPRGFPPAWEAVIAGRLDATTLEVDVYGKKRPLAAVAAELEAWIERNPGRLPPQAGMGR